MNIFRKLLELFRRPKQEEYYADYICKLPYNWIPGNNILVDSKFTCEVIEEANYKECVERLNQRNQDDLHKAEPVESIQWTPPKIIIPTWDEDYQRRKS